MSKPLAHLPSTLLTWSGAPSFTAPTPPPALLLPAFSPLTSPFSPLTSPCLCCPCSDRTGHRPRVGAGVGRNLAEGQSPLLPSWEAGETPS